MEFLAPKDTIVAQPSCAHPVNRGLHYSSWLADYYLMQEPLLVPMFGLQGIHALLC